MCKIRGDVIALLSAAAGVQVMKGINESKTAVKICNLNRLYLLVILFLDSVLGMPFVPISSASHNYLLLIVFYIDLFGGD